MKKTYVLRYLILLILFLCLSGCIKSPSTSQPPSTSSISDEFNTYLDDLFRSEVVGDTLTLHYTLAYPENYGITDYPITLGSYDVKSFEDRSNRLLEMKEELSAFPRGTLLEDQQLTYDILMDYIQTELDVSDLYLYSEILSPTTGYQAQLPILLAEYTFRNKQDIENYLTLLADIDDLFADIVKFEQKKSDAGLFMADFVVDNIVSQCQEFIENPDENYMIEVFEDKIKTFEGLSEQERSSYINKNHDLVTGEITGAYKALMDGLLALKGTGKNELGLCYFEDGKRYYEYLVRTSTGSSSSVSKLESMTDRFIMNGLNQMSEILISNPSIYDDIDRYTFSASEPTAILNDLQNQIKEDFPALPTVSYTIKYVHPSMEEHASPAFYLTPPVDDLKENFIYINEKYVDQDLYTTLAHEGYPGHLYQTVYTSSCNLPLIRNLFSYPGYTEGWATYVEHYSYGIGGLNEDLGEFLRLNSAVSLGVHAAVDMGVNYEGWDQDDVKAYLTGFGLGSDDIVTRIFQAMIEEPSNYLSYFIGYLEFLNLQDNAKKALGKDFSLKEFHTFLLETGPAPFDIINSKMKTWIAGQ